MQRYKNEIWSAYSLLDIIMREKIARHKFVKLINITKTYQHLPDEKKRIKPIDFVEP